MHFGLPLIYTYSSPISSYPSHGSHRSQQEMPCQRGLDGYVGGLSVANFADQNYVGILAQKAPQSTRERQPDLLMDLHLIDAGQSSIIRMVDSGV